MAKDTRTLKEKVTAFLARHGVKPEPAIEAAVTELLTDNQRYRQKLRDAQTEGPYRPDARVMELENENQSLEQEITRLSGLIPVAGSVVLSAEDAKAWDIFKALGKADDVKKLVTEEVPALRTKVSDAERKTAATDAASALGWNPDATTALIADKQLVVTLVDGKDKDGKAIKVPHVRPAADEKAQATPLTEWVEKNAAYLTPALTAKSAGGTGGASQGTQGTPFPVQRGGGSSPTAGDPVADFLKQSNDARAARPNPLIPRTAAATT